MKSVLIVIILMFVNSNLYCQDTIYCKEVNIAGYIVVNRKNKTKKPKNLNWISVERGYIIKDSGNVFYINNKEYKLNNIDSLSKAIR